MYWISGLPDDLPPGKYDVTTDAMFFTTCRDGTSEMIIMTTYRGPADKDDPTLLHINKELPQ